MNVTSSKSTLYKSKDVIGSVLSRWRTEKVSNFVKGRTLVDLACGDNRLVRHLGFGKGVDIKDYGDVDIVHADFTRLPFEDGSVDTVTILAALNYFDNPEATLRDIRRILKEDGVLIVTFLKKTVSTIWHKLRDRGLPRVAFSESELTALAKAAGLRITKKSHFMLGLNCVYVLEKDAHSNRPRD